MERIFPKLLIYLAIAMFSGSLSAQDNPLFNMGKFANGSKTKLFGHNVNVRNSPNTKTGTVVAQLPIGTEVTIIEESETFTINGYKAPWYKVSFIKDNEKKQGYIWGGFLSAFSFDLNDENILLYGFYGDDNIQKFMSQIKIVKSTEIVAKLNFEPINDVYEMPFNYNFTVGAKLLTGIGFDNVKNIIQINYHYPACGVPFGDIVIFWTGEKLINGTIVHGVSEAGVFHHYYEFIYPDAKTKNKLIINKISEEYDENGNELPKKTTRLTYTWENNKLTLTEQKEIK